MGITLRKKANKDGSVSLRMDIIHGGTRWIETLQALRLVKPKNALDREDNRAKLEQAKAIILSRAQQLEAEAYGAESKAAQKVFVTDWLDQYLEKYTKADKSTMRGAINDFKKFLAEEGKSKVQFGSLTPALIEDFIHFLNETHEGEGPASYYGRFRKALRVAYRKRLMRENIFDFVTVRPKGTAAKKDILTVEELKTLTQTPIQSMTVKRAAFFTAATGIRHGDLRKLTWENIDIENRILKFKQGKTGNPVEIPLNDVAIKQLGEPGKPKEKLFQLPTLDGMNKTLRKWVTRAGIQKHITWHNLRHSFGTNLVAGKTDVVTVSRLMGHASLRFTNRYVNSNNELKKEAVDSINF